jgi:hypothetical protein
VWRSQWNRNPSSCRVELSRAPASQHRPESALRVDVAGGGREHEPRARRARHQLLAEDLHLDAGERDGLLAAALVQRARDHELRVVELQHPLVEVDGLGPAEPERAAQRHDPADPLWHVRVDRVHLVELERHARRRLRADRADLEDARVDVLPARRGFAERRLEELELVPRGDRGVPRAPGDVVLDVDAAERGHRRAAERLPRPLALGEVPDARGAELAARPPNATRRSSCWSSSCPSVCASGR